MVDYLIKIVYYKHVKITIDRPSLAKVVIDVIICYHNISKLIVIDWGLFFISKFWLLLCYFLGIKQKLFTTINLKIHKHRGGPRDAFSHFLKYRPVVCREKAWMEEFHNCWGPTYHQKGGAYW